MRSSVGVTTAGIPREAHVAEIIVIGITSPSGLLWRQPNEAWIDVTGTTEINIRNLPSGCANSAVRNVEVQVGAQPWMRAQGTKNWSYRTRVTAAGRIDINVRASGECFVSGAPEPERNFSSFASTSVEMRFDSTAPTVKPNPVGDNGKLYG